MKFEDIKPGMLVTLTDKNDAKVYFVHDKSGPDYGMEVMLRYWLLDGSFASVSPVHYSLLLPVTRDQLMNRLDELDEWYDEHPEYDNDGNSCDAPIWEEYKTVISAFEFSS